MKDVFAITGSENICVMPGMPKNVSKKLKVFDLVIMSAICLFTLGKKDNVIYVFHDNAIKIKLLRKLADIKGFRVICLVNDVNSIRADGLKSEILRESINADFELIGMADIILAPNKGSQKFMTDRGMKNKIITVGVWDYLIEAPDQSRKRIHKENDPWRVAFAGNIKKSDFVYKLDEIYACNVEYHLWGDIKENEKPDKKGCIYEGSVHPNELPALLSQKSDIGLVWDGSSIDNIEGGLGEYLKFNNSHKCGCYLASGIPVFVHEDSGMAYFVRENGCGFTISSLRDIPRILENLSDEEYIDVVKNTNIVAGKIREGYYLRRALQLAIERQ